MNKKFGFTLAEVLITLGIIGVVAAMTIPTLIANTNSAKFRSQFKKSISTLNQAALMSQAQDDVQYSHVLASAVTAGDNGELSGLEDPETKATLVGIITKNTTATGSLTAPADYAPKAANGTDNLAHGVVADKTPIYISFPDSSMVVLYKEAAKCTKAFNTDIKTWAETADNAVCLGYIDVNGATGPNREVNCNNDANIANGVCTVASTATELTDIYPVAFHDTTVEPITDAGRYVLTTSK